MLGVIGNKFSIGKDTYHPYSAELHYFRIDKKYWSICFERIKRAGFRIITTAVPWNIHQDDNKMFDFAGLTDPRKDLIVFLELAREFGFKVILRPGPWISGQMKNGGLPRYLFNDIKVFARNSKGEELQLPSDYGVEGGYLPSYMHRNFQYHVKNYFKVFIETTKNYVHPRGPIFMVELDYETSFGRMLDPSSADYNPDVLEMYYGPFLENLYEGNIKKLNLQYKEKNTVFSDVEPPREFTGLDWKDYSKIIDWMKFREFMLRSYLDVVEDIFKAYTVEPLIFRSLYFNSGDLLPAFNLVPEDRQPFLGSNVFPSGTYFDLINKARFLKAEYGFAFATSFTSGAAAEYPKREEEVAPIPENVKRFYLSAALAAGFKGLNHYMFVDREHWYGAPLHNDGTVASGYDVLQRFNMAISMVGLEEMDYKQEIAVVGNRLYDWLRLVERKKSLVYLDQLLGNSATGFCRDLMRLKHNYAIRENNHWESFSQYRLLFIPTCEIMSVRDQEAIVELIKNGVTVVLCGLMPRFDENLKDCQILANHFRIKTTADYFIGNIDLKTGSSPARIYASIRSTDDAKVRKLVKSGSKLVGVCSSRYKGNLYLFSFDIASGGNHQKLSFIESILDGEGIKSSLFCDHPSVDVSFQMGEKKGLLFVVAPPPGVLSDGIETMQKDIIIQADLKQLGMKAPKLKLIDIFGGEESAPIKVSSKELKEGISLNFNFPDGAIFLVQKG